MLSKYEAEQILQEEYHKENLVLLFKNLFEDYVNENLAYEADKNKFKSCVQIGESRSCEIKVFEVFLVADMEKRRVGITKEMFKILKSYHTSNALVVFINEDKNNFRLSLLTTSYVINDDKKLEKELSNPRRFSYYLGKGTKTKTVYDMLIAKGFVGSLDDLKNRFSVEAVNKQFYKEIAFAFTKLVGGYFEGTYYDRELQFTNSVENNKYPEFGVRLIGRLIFCWFLKEKKSKAEVPLVPEDIFDIRTIKGGDNYYTTILQPLFFELLNVPWKERAESLRREPYSLIPYLNGGLFSPHEDDFYFGPGSNNVYIPDKWFVDLINVFRQYNFTVDESTSYDVELSIDPEMLGRIFENLLAEINPETGEDAKKNTGSFYTPRDIVEYMVDTSLIEHLKTHTSINHETIEKIMRYDVDIGDVEITQQEKEIIVKSLVNLKVMDPACGSGAFPIGVLQKMVFLLQQLDPNNDILIKTIPDIPLLADELKNKIDSGSHDYMRKMLIIRNCIFGVDIQPIAVEISRLRCFLSLIIEEEIDDAAENRGVEPLPNLDFKFVIANTLIKLEDKADNEQGYLFADTDYIDKMASLRDAWFGATDAAAKESIKKGIRNVQKEMQGIVEAFKIPKTARFARLSQWRPFASVSNEWFDAAWMFGEKNFDIVIGNPPYIRLERRVNPGDNQDKTKFSDLYEDYDYKTFMRKGDIYCLFYEKGFDLLKDDGILTFITSNAWMKVGYAAEPSDEKMRKKHTGLRKYLATQNPLILINFSGEKIFEAATVYVNILVCQKTINRGHTWACTGTKQCRNNLSDFIKQNGKDCSFKTSDEWLLTNSIVKGIKNKVESKGTPLKDWNINIRYGIKTGLNDVFLIDTDMKNKLVTENPKSVEIIQPVLRGKDIKRYGCVFSNKWIINAHNGLPEKGIKPVNINDYPAVKRHLDLYFNKIATRQDQGDTPYNLRSCAYLEDFSKPKIIYPSIMQDPRFLYDCVGYIGINSTYFITGENIEYLIGFLNSSLFRFCFKENFPQLGEKGRDYRKAYIAEIPVKKVNSDINDLFAQLIEKIQSSTQKNDYNLLDQQIDDLIFEIYDLTPEEIETVLSSAKLED